MRRLHIVASTSRLVTHDSPDVRFRPYEDMSLQNERSYPLPRFLRSTGTVRASATFGQLNFEPDGNQLARFRVSLRQRAVRNASSPHSAGASFDRGFQGCRKFGLIATMSAFVLDLLIASAKDSYDTQRAEVTQMSADSMQLDRVLAHYGRQRSDTHNRSSLV